MISINPEAFKSQSYFFKWLSEQEEIINPFSFIPPAEPLQLEIPIVEQKVLVPSTSSEFEELHKQTSEDENYEVIVTRRGKIINRRNDQDLRKNGRDPNFNPKKQKKNRNVLSNLVHHLMKYLAEFPYMRQRVSRIISQHCMGITCEQFMSILIKIQEKFKGYVTEKNLKNLWQGLVLEDKPQIDRNRVQQFSKITRILSSHFFRGDCMHSILFSNKLSLQSKNLHYQGLKELRDCLSLLGSDFN